MHEWWMRPRPVSDHALPGESWAWTVHESGTTLPFRNTLVFSARPPSKRFLLGKIWGGPRNELAAGSYPLSTAKQMSLLNKFSENLGGHLQAPRSQRLRARASDATIAPRHGRLVGNPSWTNPEAVSPKHAADLDQTSDSLMQVSTNTQTLLDSLLPEYSRCSIDAESVLQGSL